MRCLKCKVDLPDTYTTCPLCHEEVSDEKNILNGFPEAPYPKNAPILPMEQLKKPKVKFGTEQIKAFFTR